LSVQPHRPGHSVQGHLYMGAISKS
jgi:hypothetical protein